MSGGSLSDRRKNERRVPGHVGIKRAATECVPFCDPK